MNIYVLDRELALAGIIDNYKSLIWANRYRETGDCELYLPATTEALALLRKDYYLIRDDDDMVCRIQKIELTTSPEEGNYLAVYGYDTKKLLDQRIVWETTTVDGKAETFLRKLVTKAAITPSIPERAMTKPGGGALLTLGPAAGLKDVASEQVSYKNVGEKIREYCQRYGWGYRTTLNDDHLEFELYKGTDRSDWLVFSEDYENLAATKYTEDETHMGNVALVAGIGEGPDRQKTTSGAAESLERYEQYVDAKDLSNELTFEELDDQYQGYVDGLIYKVATLDVIIQDAAQLARLQAEFPGGTEVTIDGINYYRISQAPVATLPSSTPDPNDSVVLWPYIYETYLLTRGYEKLAEYGAVTSFEGQIEPEVTFIYKTDYNLGDIVAIESSYGISVNARITEVVEVDDDNGYRVEPSFEYIEED